jgi:hypothetical protein
VLPPGSVLVPLVEILAVLDAADELSIRAMNVPVIARTPAQSHAPEANARSSIAFDRSGPRRSGLDITPPVTPPIQGDTDRSREVLSEL